MLLLVLSSALAVGLTVVFIASLFVARPAAVGRRIEEVRHLTHDSFDAASQSRRRERLEKVEGLLEVIGSRSRRTAGPAGWCRIC
jgi:hypothetical protein